MDRLKTGKKVMEGGIHQDFQAAKTAIDACKKEHYRMRKTTWRWLGAAVFAVLLPMAHALANEPKAGSSGESTHAHSHDHEHGHDHTSKGSIHDGYFRDEQVQPRPLSDWAGEWQSVYPYLVDGTLDAVLAQKAEKGDKTMEEYRTYYDGGYRTETNRIVIDGNRVAFVAGEDSVEGEYVSDGFEILTYEKGNRGVRYVFEKVDGDDKAPAFIQFSDHLIAPERSWHYHLYWGNDREALLEEVSHWPTYYPSALTGEEIAKEMLAH
jgi:zinc transport system substrate-binding protein